MTDIIVFDLDGTLALNQHREHFIKGPKKDWDAYFEACYLDEPNEPILQMLRSTSRYKPVQIWSGRSYSVHSKTEWWLRKFNAYTDIQALRMRPVGDFTPDEELKRRWLYETRAAGNNVTLVFDDRDKVVKMWREEGIACCQVAPGDF